MIQSVLSSIPAYYLSPFELSKAVANVMERMMSDFLWEGFGEGRRDCLVAWEKVCMSKRSRGLGWKSNLVAMVYSSRTGGIVGCCN